MIVRLGRWVIFSFFALGLLGTVSNADDRYAKIYWPLVDTPLQVTATDYVFAIGPNHDLYAIQMNHTHSGHAELTVVASAGHYQHITLNQVVTPITDPGDFLYSIAPDTGDLYLLKVYNTAGNHFEIHALSRASNYQDFIVHAGTPIVDDPNNFLFFVAFGNQDVFLIKTRNTGTNQSEIHVLTQASGYSAFSLQAALPIPEDPSTFKFALEMDSSRSIYALETKNTSTHSTEVHEMCGPGFGTKCFDSGSILPEDPSGDFLYAVDETRNLYAIKVRHTTSGKVQVMIIAAGPFLPPKPAPKDTWCIYVMLNNSIWGTETFHGSQDAANAEGVDLTQKDGGDTYLLQAGPCP